VRKIFKSRQGRLFNVLSRVGLEVKSAPFLFVAFGKDKENERSTNFTIQLIGF
jgi:hypothetical protein